MSLLIGMVFKIVCFGIITQIGEILEPFGPPEILNFGSGMQNIPTMYDAKLEFSNNSKMLKESFL